MSSPIYWHPVLYKTTMRLLYGKGYENRYEEVVRWIPPGSSVYEACAGDCRLYLRYLRPLGIDYRAGDFNSRFVEHGRRHGIAIDLLDLRKDRVPLADVVILQASLYQFLPDAGEILTRLAASAKKRLVLVEPVRNLASSKNPVVAWLGKLGAGTKDQTHAGRFTEKTISALMAETFGNRVVHAQLIAEGREKLFCVSTEN